MGLPENIDALLVKFDITQEQLARVAGVNPSSVARWRHGSQMRRPYVERVCEYFGLTEDDLLSTDAGLAAKEHGVVIEYGLSDDERELVSKCQPFRPRQPSPASCEYTPPSPPSSGLFGPFGTRRGRKEAARPRDGDEPLSGCMSARTRWTPATPRRSRAPRSRRRRWRPRAAPPAPRHASALMYRLVDENAESRATGAHAPSALT